MKELTTAELEMAAHALYMTLAAHSRWPKEDKARYRALARRFKAEIEARQKAEDD